MVMRADSRVCASLQDSLYGCARGTPRTVRQPDFVFVFQVCCENAHVRELGAGSENYEVCSARFTGCTAVARCAWRFLEGRPEPGAQESPASPGSRVLAEPLADTQRAPLRFPRMLGACMRVRFPVSNKIYLLRGGPWRASQPQLLSAFTTARPPAVLNVRGFEQSGLGFRMCFSREET